MCAKKPEDRYQSCDELFEQLELVQLKEKTGRNYDVEKSELVSVLQLEKAKSLEKQVEMLEVRERLRRMTIIAWITGALSVVIAAIAFALLYLVSRSQH
jgi:hypothetical protein